MPVWPTLSNLAGISELNLPKQFSFSPIGALCSSDSSKSFPEVRFLQSFAKILSR